jgi:hypothetical protein
VSTRKDLIQARRAFARGRSDEALVIVWNLVEPARLEGDEGTLRAIAALAGAIAQKDEGHRREAERLLEALGRAVPAHPKPEPAEVEYEDAAEPEPSVAPVAEERQLEIERSEPAGAAPGDAERSPRRPGASRWVIPLVTLAVILVNVIARVFGDD